MMVRVIATFAAILFCALVLVPRGGLAQLDLPFSNDEELSSPRIWIQNLDSIETMVERGQAEDPQMVDALKTVLQEIIDEAKGSLALDRQRLKPLNAEMRTLGPPPAEGEAPESEELADIRADLTGRIAEVEGRMKATDLVIAKAQNLMSRVSGTVRTEISRLFERSPSIFERETWQKAGEELKALIESIKSAPLEWWSSDSRRTRGLQIAFLAIGLLIAYPFASNVRRFLLRHIHLQETEREATASSRIFVDCIRAVRQLFIPLLALGLVLGVIVVVLDVNQFFP